MKTEQMCRQGCEEIWTAAQHQLIRMVDQESWERFIAGLVPVSYDPENSVFSLGVLNDFLCTWLEKNYRELLETALSKVIEKPTRIDFLSGYTPVASPLVVNAERKTEPAVTAKPESRSACSTTQSLRMRSTVSRRPARDLNVRPDFTFDTFVVGDNNKVCVAAARAVADNPGRSYNPLFVYGGCGLGKTHLVQAIANEIVRKNPDAVIEYLTSEEFVNLYVEAVQENKTSEFRRRFRNIDALLIDDVQFFKGKVGSTEEFFHTFNTLYNAHKQIVLVADRTPHETGLEDRIVSRFAWGLPTEILPPNFETRLAILRKKQENKPIQLDDNILAMIASRIQSNIRNLESALTLLSMNVSAGIDLTLEFAERLIEERFDVSGPREIRIENIQKIVAHHFDVRLSDLLGNKRPKNIATARMVAMYLARRLTDQSFPAIAEQFNRNHATVVHAVDTISRRLESEERLRTMVTEIERQLKA
ncbi:MAG: chromosomal replication initiator protein DnaA [Lentisphaerae bacterium]|nr:MAG: chromosomal replication initiator protein DnaA [Lentisphaerota bacterium]